MNRIFSILLLPLGLTFFVAADFSDDENDFSAEQIQAEMRKKTDADELSDLEAVEQKKAAMVAEIAELEKEREAILRDSTGDGNQTEDCQKKQDDLLEIIKELTAKIMEEKRKIMIANYMANAPKTYGQGKTTTRLVGKELNTGFKAPVKNVANRQCCKRYEALKAEIGLLQKKTKSCR